MNQMNRYSGVLAATGAYVAWGVLPIYWKALQNVPAYEILCHRMAWSLVFTMGLLVLLHRHQSFFKLMRGDKSHLVIFTVAATLLAVNWLVYIWSVNSGYILEASLGYFINPLVSVLFGVVFFQEKLRKGQCLALLLALAGVVYLTVYYGRFPWIALVLAGSFGIYGLLHKKTSLPALDGLCLEAMILFVPAVGFLLFTEVNGTGSFLHTDISTSFLLIGTGLVTSLPLLLFGYAAQKIPLSLLGLLQYMAPTINLLLGIFLYNEEFPQTRMIGFMMVWAALLLYLLEGLLMKVRCRKAML